MGMKVFQGISKALRTGKDEDTNHDELYLKHETIELLNFFLINMNIDLDMSTEILAHLARENNIQPNFYANLVDQLESNYHQTDMKRLLHKKREIAIVGKEKRKKMIPKLANR